MRFAGGGQSCTEQEYSSLLTAHLEHNERCLRVLEVGIGTSGACLKA